MNPKGGLFSYDEKQKVFLADEKKYGFVVDETCHYIRVKVDGDKGASYKKGRLKLKGNVKAVK